MIDEPARIRLQRIVDDRRSSRFPPGHPPMRSFLGVPVRVRDEIPAKLDLAESTRDMLTAEDEALIAALAATAAATDNDPLSTTKARQDWLRLITKVLLLTEPEGTQSPLQLIADRPARWRMPMSSASMWTSSSAGTCRSTVR